MKDINLYCMECEKWVTVPKSQAGFKYRLHSHVGLQLSYLMGVEWPIPIKSKPLAGPTVKLLASGRWRAYWVVHHSGYSQNPSWGHDAGGWSHMHERAMRNPATGAFNDFDSREAAIAFISNLDSELYAEPDVECGAGGYL